MNDADVSRSKQAHFIDHMALNWKDVRRTRSLFYQRFQYQYPGPIYNLRQRLVVVPARQYGTQQLCDHHVVVNPAPVSVRQLVDAFGNQVLELELDEADKSVLFEVSMIIETGVPAPEEQPLAAHAVGHWLKPTHLTRPDKRIKDAAKALKSKTTTQHDLAQAISDWVYASMEYKDRVTAVDTTASQALALGQGLCQDYSHIMLALCRAANLPARYVSGHLLGDGGSHAWVEVFLPSENGLRAAAFDPTNNRRPYLDYVTVAVGRDYRDVSPTSGTFTASYGGELTCGKHAGLIEVEFHNGEILASPILH